MDYVQPDIPAQDQDNATDPLLPDKEDYSDFLKLAKAAYEEGDDFQLTLRKRWNDNYALARSEHPAGSKYHSKTYKNRSRAFRGKTEASIRKNEAACAVAFFSNPDVVTIRAVDPDNPEQDAISKALHELANFRFDKMKWFMLVLGAFHETMVPGDIISKQYWDDGPECELLPPECVKVSPSANWIDPINSSPYLVIETPMYVGDIRDKMDSEEWLEYTDAQIISSVPNKEDKKDTQVAREGGIAQTREERSSVNDFSIAWVHENYIKKSGVDYVFYTLGTKHLLTDPESVQDVYPHTVITGKRNVVMGTSTIEPFSVNKRSLTDRVKGTQVVANEVSNQRIDNVKLVLNKRWFAQRGANIDYATMRQSVPGSVIQTDDVNALKAEEVNDVTSSSYQEQHMLNADFDELAGSFSTGSVMTNRALNETVGGMNMMKGDSNALTEYQLRIFGETWAEPVVREIVALIQMHEEDENILLVTGQQIPREALLSQRNNVKVSIGFGATDPIGRVNKLMMGLQSLLAYFPDMAAELDKHAISDEVFGLLGYQDGKKFFLPTDVDPRIKELTEQLEKLVQFIETEQLKHGQKIEEINAKGKWDMGEENMRLMANRNLKLTEMAIGRNKDDKDSQARSQVDQGRLRLDALSATIKMIEASVHKKEIDAKVAGTIKEGI